jgi:hypothetical protein
MLSWAGGETVAGEGRRGVRKGGKSSDGVKKQGKTERKQKQQTHLSLPLNTNREKCLCIVTSRKNTVSTAVPKTRPDPPTSHHPASPYTHSLSTTLTVELVGADWQQK